MHSAYIFIFMTSLFLCSVTRAHKQHKRAKVVVNDGVTSVVTDITQSTNIADREKSLKELAEPIHVPKTAAVNGKNPNLEGDNVKTNPNTVKRNSIAHPAEESDDTEDTPADEATPTTSGSGEETTKLVEEAPKVKDNLVSKKQISVVAPKCHQRCEMPMTFEQCALPRCSYKIRPIRTLCFSLCRNQKKRCVEVCE